MTPNYWSTVNVKKKKKDLPTAQICKIDYLGSVLYGKNTSHQIQFTEIQTSVKWPLSFIPNLKS